MTLEEQRGEAPFPEDLLQVRGAGVCFHVLRDANGLYLIDGGFIGGRAALSRALKRRGWNREPIRGIIVTHGHLDHTFNIAALAAETGAWVAAPMLDAEHYAGRYPYQGVARVCGVLEGLGRRVFKTRPLTVDRPLEDLSEIPVWHGLTAIHLPGHTVGQMGFYCAGLRLLFSADLFASYRISHFPPAILNSCPERMAGSVARALELDLAGVLPNHCDRAAPATHLERLRRLAARQSSKLP